MCGRNQESPLIPVIFTAIQYIYFKQIHLASYSHILQRILQQLPIILRLTNPIYSLPTQLSLVSHSYHWDPHLVPSAAFH